MADDNKDPHRRGPAAVLGLRRLRRPVWLLRDDARELVPAPHFTGGVSSCGPRRCHGVRSVLTTIGGMRRAASRPHDRCMARHYDTVIVGGGADGGTQARTYALRGKQGLAPGRPAGTSAVPPSCKANGDSRSGRCALIGNGTSRTGLYIGYLVGAAIMLTGGIVEFFLGVNAACKSLEAITKPLTSTDETVPAGETAPAAAVTPWPLPDGPVVRPVSQRSSSMTGEHQSAGRGGSGRSRWRFILPSRQVPVLDSRRFRAVIRLSGQVADPWRGKCSRMAEFAAAQPAPAGQAG